MKTFITLIPQIIVFIASIITIGWSSRVALRKERRQLLWSKELERFLALEELAGQLTEDVTSYRPLDSPSLAPRMEELSRAAGRFARYAMVRCAILQLYLTMTRMLRCDGGGKELQLHDELGRNLRELLKECDKITGRHKFLG